MIVIEGGDGTGKSTLVASLRDLGYRVKDRGAMTRASVSKPSDGSESREAHLYVLLDAPVEVSLQRLEAAGKDMKETWHTPESLTHFRQVFLELAPKFGAVVIDATASAGLVLRETLKQLGLGPSHLQVGIPKGRLLQTLRDRLMAADCVLPSGTDRVYWHALPHADLGLLKPRALPQLVALGILDAAFVGWDLFTESPFGHQLDFHDLGLSPVRLVVASTPGLFAGGWRELQESHRPVTIATEYPNIAHDWAAKRGLAHIVVETPGATEAYVPKCCDLALDVVETGDTLKANGLVIAETLYVSTTGIITRRGSAVFSHTFFDPLFKRAPL